MSRACDFFEAAVSWGELLAILALVSFLLIVWEIVAYREEERRRR